MNAVRVFCLPFAGAGATVYRGWQPPLGIAIVPVQLAAREERFAESSYPTMDAAADDVAARIEARAGGERFAVFGHSFGAILAYEVARRLCERTLTPAHLLVSGSADPGTALGRHSSELGDVDFLARVEQLAGYAHPALADAELRDVLLPSLRADFALHESYEPRTNARLPIPITVLRGRDDGAVGRHACAGWKRWTSVRCDYRELDGGHMYFSDDPRPLMRVMRDTLSETAGRTA